MKTVALLATAAFALTSVAASALALPAKTYVMKAGASDMFETESSKLVTDSSDPKVVSYANMMISDHARSTSDVMSAAQADGVTAPPPMLTPKQKTMIDSLKATNGKKRDLLYKKDQITAHKETLAFQKEYAMSGDKPNLKAAAGKIVPVVQNHLDMANNMTPAGAKAM